jgi:hypothetical protein
MWKNEPWFVTDQHERMVKSQTLWDRFGVQWDQLSVVEGWVMGDDTKLLSKSDATLL